MFNKPAKTKLGEQLASRVLRIASKEAPEGEQYRSEVASRIRAPRVSTFKPAAITLSGGQRMDVVVKNVSETGARIEFVPRVTLPDQVMVAEPTLRIRTWALVVWQGGGAAGLKFLAT